MKLLTNLFTLFILLSTSPIIAQVSFSSRTLVVAKQTTYLVQLDDEATAGSIVFNQNVLINNVKLIAEKDTFSIIQDPDFTVFSRSQLCVFEKPVKTFTLFSGSLEGSITFNGQYIKPLIISHLQLRIRADSCEKPAVIAASEWRKGLTPPKESPARTTVKHVIVHHSAGSNSTTNFLEAVRNIYTFHTSSPPNGNGWNDVGYNFLIAQDGTIFQGRDGQNTFDGDNVLGAHFCGKNGATMGICLLGNYNTVQPSNAAIKSLINLAGWKLAKEKLPVIGQFQHVDGPLNILSGHRDGCATDCPGNNVYARLAEFRQQVSKACVYTNSLITTTETPDNEAFMIYPQPSSEFITVEIRQDFLEKNAPQIIDMQGKTLDCSMSRTDEKHWQINIKHLAEGSYFLRLGNQSKAYKFVKN